MIDGRQRDTDIGRYRGPALALAVIGAAIAGLGYYRNPVEFFTAYLFAFLFFWGVSLGSLAIAMLHALTGGEWGYSIRRQLEAAYSTLPLVAVLFIPLAFGLEVLYPWARESLVATDPVLQKKAAYLNPTAWEARAVGYFVLWLGLALAMNRFSVNESIVTRQRRLALLAGPGLVIWVLTVTFAAVDWVMSLEPNWSSSMYGVLFVAAQGVSGLALAILVTSRLREREPWREVAQTSRLHDLGNLLLAFVMFWTYVVFMQFLIIWSGNLPEETPWYLRRIHGGWQWIVLALAAFHFALPFLLLLSRNLKRHPRRLAAVATTLLAMRLVDLYWLVMPAFFPALSFGWIDAAVLLGLGGLWSWAYLGQLESRSARVALDIAELQESTEGAIHATV
ncbi:MAG TPA: hypothetical protein VL175_07235 [Pirellulales bacterium]|jgi:hypothetical protein|nr:hypothetical protein [Pirellulales bacterium]